MKRKDRIVLKTAGAMLVLLLSFSRKEQSW